MSEETQPSYRIDHGFLCRGVHFIIINSTTLNIECSWCKETGSIFHTGATYDASLQGKWVAKATEHLINEHPDKIGRS
jgi:hypothetical protein